MAYQYDMLFRLPFAFMHQKYDQNYEKDYISTLTEKGTGNDETIFRGLVCKSVLKVVVIFEICEQKQY